MVDSLNGSLLRWKYTGYDPDNHATLESYTTGTAYINRSATPQLVIWHTGLAVGQLFGAANESQLPPPFDDTKQFDPMAWEA